MTEADIKIMLQKAKKLYPEARPGIISDNGPQFIAKSLDDGRRLVQDYVDHYNNVRLNSAVGYITPKDMLMLAGRSKRSTRSATGSWRRRGSNDGFVASKSLDVQ
jgi:putative transposase